MLQKCELKRLCDEEEAVSIHIKTEILNGKTIEYKNLEYLNCFLHSSSSGTVFYFHQQ